MTDPIHNGDLATYTGTVRRLRGKRCEVVERLPYRYAVIVLLDGVYQRRFVSERNLEKVGGGGLLEGESRKSKGESEG